MINANELRIGNWVQDFGDGYGKVTGIYSGNPAYDEDSDVLTTANPVPQPASTFFAIPLTNELIEKAGFDFRILTESPGYYKDSGRSSLRIWAEGVDAFCYSASEYHRVNINHVHQLQNLYFALTGEELNFNLQ